MSNEALNANKDSGCLYERQHANALFPTALMKDSKANPTKYAIYAI